MKSMTGYGRALGTLGEASLTVQINSVNRKTLDLALSIPDAWEALEAEIGERVRACAARGTVHVSIQLTGPAGENGPPWDTPAINAVLDKLAALAAARGVSFAPTPELLWSVAHSQRRAPELPSADAARQAVMAAIDAALADFTAMRAREGATLLADLLARLEGLKSHLEEVAARAPRVAPAYREMLHRRLREAGLTFDLNDERVLREIALFADRCDVSEEITRFRSHLEQFTSLLKSDGEIGRKAEFILQELGREVHTLGAKANDLTIARHVIELKNELERVKEQIANVE